MNCNYAICNNAICKLHYYLELCHLCFKLLFIVNCFDYPCMGVNESNFHVLWLDLGDIFIYIAIQVWQNLTDFNTFGAIKTQPIVILLKRWNFLIPYWFYPSSQTNRCYHFTVWPINHRLSSFCLLTSQSGRLRSLHLFINRKLMCPCAVLMVNRL